MTSAEKMPIPDQARMLREVLAAIEHARWADWQRWVHSVCTRNPDGSLTIPATLVERWERQIATPYDQLSAREKEADREQVDRYWPLIAGRVGRQRLSAIGAVAERLLPDGRRLAVLPLLFGQARLGLGRVLTPTGELEDGFDDVWDYPSLAAARRAMAAFDPAQTPEPDGWHRHPASGRRRAPP